MISETIRHLIATPGKESYKMLYGGNETSKSFFWIDWREREEEIVYGCESVLKTGVLSDERSGERLFITYRDVRIEVPLTQSPEDRHITLLALNELLFPDYEVRLTMATACEDTAALAPLTCAEWEQLEAEYGADAVSRAFHRLQKHPILFKENDRFLASSGFSRWSQYWE